MPQPALAAQGASGHWILTFKDLGSNVMKAPRIKLDCKSGSMQSKH